MKKRQNVKRSKPSKRPRQPGKFIWLLFAVTLVLILMANEDFLSDKDGEPILAPWRKAKLERELEEMEFGEQYVLLARIAGFFPCLNCPNQQDIFLNAREVWKYGVTSKGRQGRYGGKLPHPGLLYKVEFEGLLRDCYKLEKLKIYNYALLPENLRRENRLIRPPGNKQDN